MADALQDNRKALFTKQRGDSSQVPEDDVTRALPHAVGPEKSLLSTMLQDPHEYIGRAIEEKLTSGHFYLPNHTALFGFLTELFEDGVEIELVSLVQRLLDRGELEKVGGPGYITELYTYAPSPGHFHHHLQHVKDKFTLRAIIRSSNEAVAQAYEAPDEVPALLDSVEQSILSIRESAETNHAQTLEQTVKEVMRNFQMLISKEKSAEGITTGFEELDRKSGGLKPGEMFVVAARPSMGKTSFMMNIAEHVCLDLGKACMVFSCEMSSVQLVQRLLFARAKFSVSKLSRGYEVKKAELMRIRSASAQIMESKLFIDDTAGISINELRAKARRKAREEKLEFIAIDYLQLMKSRTRQAETLSRTGDRRNFRRREGFGQRTKDSDSGSCSAESRTRRTHR